MQQLLEQCGDLQAWLHVGAYRGEQRPPKTVQKLQPETRKTQAFWMVLACCRAIGISEAELVFRSIQIPGLSKSSRCGRLADAFPMSHPAHAATN